MIPLPEVRDMLERDVPGILRCAAIRAHAKANGNGGIGFDYCRKCYECRVYIDYCDHINNQRRAASPAAPEPTR